jgi:hypothetical protein
MFPWPSNIIIVPYQSLIKISGGNNLDEHMTLTIRIHLVGQTGSSSKGLSNITSKKS